MVLIIGLRHMIGRYITYDIVVWLIFFKYVQTLKYHFKLSQYELCIQYQKLNTIYISLLSRNAITIHTKPYAIGKFLRNCEVKLHAFILSLHRFKSNNFIDVKVFWISAFIWFYFLWRVSLTVLKKEKSKEILHN